jgi:predicted PurR-regulated permease PerM
MKLPYDKKYATISAYAFLVIVTSVTCILCLINITSVLSAVRSILNVVGPFITGAMIAYVLNPILKAIERFMNRITNGKISRRLNRSVSMLGSYLFAIAVLTALIVIILPQLFESITNLVPQITSWFRALPALLNTLQARYDIDLEILNDETSTLTKNLTNILNQLQTNFTNFVSSLTSLIPQLFQFTTAFVSRILNLIISVIVSIYLLSSKELLYAHVKKFCYALLPGRVVNKLLEITHTSNEIFSGFIVGKLIDSAIIGLICFTVMALFQWPYAMLISVIIGVTNIIPYFGPFIGGIPSILLLLIVDPVSAVKFTIFIIILQQVDGNIIGPKILGDTTGLSAFWVVFSITIFSALLGPIGMIIGVPTFAVIYSLIREISEWLLRRKNLATDTDAYASPDQPIIHKDKSPPHPRPLSEEELDHHAETEPESNDEAN